MIERIAHFWIVLIVGLLCIAAICITGLALGHDGALISSAYTLIGAVLGGGGVYGGLKLQQRNHRNKSGQ